MTDGKQRQHEQDGRSRRGQRGGEQHQGQHYGRGGQKAIGPCPEGITKHGMQAISAPYNFVPLSTWVYRPKWGRQVSHDLPFKEALSGQIAYRLTADTPLLVGGHQDKSVSPQRVTPFRLPGGGYAIPGSSIKGMLRTLIEIAGFGRLRMVDDGRPGLRDITGRHVKDAYTAKVRDRVRTGFLRHAQDGGLEIVPCRMARLDHRDLEGFFGIGAPIFRARISVARKFSRWQTLCRQKDRDPGLLAFDLDGRNAKPRGGGLLQGIPVFTGQISDSTRPHGKRRDFVFYDRDDERPIPVPTDSWRDFLRIHGNDETGKRGEEMSWPGYWKRIHRNGGDVPVFYVQDSALLRIGLAYMPKLAGDFSIQDMIGHAAEDHNLPPGLEHGYDLADLLFGAVNGERQADALRGRVSCETAQSEGNLVTKTQPDTILNGPKPTYFPNYIRQDADNRDWTLRGGKNAQYATYVETQGSRRPTLRGFKRYPARPLEQSLVQPLTEEQKQNTKVQVNLTTLEPGSSFAGLIVFHNLVPVELGALLWAMTWGGSNELRHGLGMGKSFGFGQISIAIDADASRLIPNDPDAPAEVSGLPPERATELVNTFSEHMELVCSANGHGWANSLQVANLLAMADPNAARDLPTGMELRHMQLQQCRRDGRNERINEFQWAKQPPNGPFVLADYAMASGRVAATGGGTLGADGGSAGAEPASDLHPWVREKVSELMQSTKAPEGDVIRSKGLASAWSAIDEAELKAAALASIRSLWQANDWWDEPPGRSARKAKAIYQPGD